MDLLSFFKGLFRKDAPPAPADVLFIGLGNIGARYAKSRHNAGFRIADALVRRLGGVRSGTFSEADYFDGTLFDTKKAAVVKPRTLMNRSGIAAAAYLRACGCSPSGMLVMVDDYNLPLGTMRARRSGSDGGHNGLKSIIGHIGDQFPRLRIGIGPVPAGMPSVDFVLSDFSGDEERKLLDVAAKAEAACLLFAQQGIEAVMNRFNT
jgi:PTH1 family peptidyl-tRNA hydrolase